MDLNLPALGPTCIVTGERFTEGERVVSQLVRHPETGEVVRCDMSAAAEPDFAPAGRVACRWVHTFKPRQEGENPERELKLTAENLFVTLADPANELSEENLRLVQFLALMLERKRLLRPRGRTSDGTKNIFEHAKSKQRFEVPAGELDPQFFLAVQEQLSVLVGEPKSADKVANGGTEQAPPPEPRAGA